jgi:hypothetical protein
MLIPKKITVGKKTYAVMQVRNTTDGVLGRIDYNNEVIWLATHDAHGTKLHKKELYDSFWHELTHAVLHDMRHTLRDDEKFVTAFANRFSHAIDNAVV